MVWWSDSSGRVAKSLRTLYDQVNAAYPNRETGSDGTIGDPAHQATRSEHNKDENGIVRALDLTNSPSTGFSSRKLAEALINSGDDRIYYVISDGQIANPAIQNGAWRTYNGSSPHTGHMHISVVDDPRLYDDTSPWQIDAKPVEKVPGRHYGITATFFGGAADPNDSAYDGHRITDTEYGVALPYKWPAGAVRPKVRVFKGGKSVVANIVDVGPWNTNDPYWEKGTRPQAESGIDLSGRRTNKAGIDVTPAINKALALNGKGLVDWEFVKDNEPTPEPSPEQSDLQAQISACLRRLDTVEKAIAELKRTSMPQNDSGIDLGKALKPVIDAAIAEFNKQLPTLIGQLGPVIIRALLSRFLGGGLFTLAGMPAVVPPPVTPPPPAPKPLNPTIVAGASAAGGGTVVAILTALANHFLGGG